MQENDSSRSIRALRAHGKKRLSVLEDSRLAAHESRILLCAAADLSATDMIAHGERLLSPTEAARFSAFLERRLAGEPVNRIVGQAIFYGLSFRVTPEVLDPRADTEILIDAVLNRFGDSPPATVLDLGTGTGCILISLLHAWPQAQGVGVDISPAALAVAKQNAADNGVADRGRFVESDWGGAVTETFDLVVSNPPYIPNHEMPTLDPAVRDHDPILALAGGEMGLNAYEAIFFQLSTFLKPGGRGFFEVGYQQAEAVARLAENHGATLQAIHPDLAGIPRVVEIVCGDK
ncbi:MAG: peptide chain release factor N(5)-glutamine methyltransferase [Alphaproteobacteria bacterium]|nr:peptide chain release factor N(5)-glutamine methyltransferase [Alphaproteobacteria bacterium]